MSNELRQQGSLNIAIQDVREGANVEVTQTFAKSYEYKDLLDKLKTKQKLFDRTPEDETDERLQLSAEINHLEEIFEQFKRDVLALAETFNKIEINTDRLKRAKEFFDNGEISKTRAVLEMELEQMQYEQTHLLKEKEHFEQDVLPNLINNSEEFLLLAMATQTNYDNPHLFEDTCKYFEDSIKSYPNKNNVFNYAKFLQDHNQFKDAETYYFQFLHDFPPLSEDDYAIALGNIAALHQAQNKYQCALQGYEEALKIYRKLSEANPNTFLPFVAGILNNLAALHQAQKSYQQALQEYEEALKIYRKLSETNPNTYLPFVAGILINLSIYFQEAVVQRKKSFVYVVEAIDILLPIVEKTPFMQRCMQQAILVLKKWNFGDEEIDRKIAANIEENRQN